MNNNQDPFGSQFSEENKANSNHENNETNTSHENQQPQREPEVFYQTRPNEPVTPQPFIASRPEYMSMDYNEPPKQKKQTPTWVTAIASAVVGGLIVLACTPLLYRAGIIPSGNGTLDSSYSGPSKSTSVQVNSNITEAVAKVQNAVVGIDNIAKSDDFFSSGGEDRKQGTGSGIIFEKNKDTNKALVATNYHVIADNQSVQVNLPAEKGKSKPVTAKVLGTDPITDLAVLEIDATNVTTVADFGNSDAVKAGEPAIAIGNPLGPQFSQSVTVGVISSAKRTIDLGKGISTDVIQTDAAINPGNSGGALLNAAGQVIGINSLKIAEQGVEGLGFAIPSNEARPLLNALIKHGKVPRPYLGVELIDLDKISPAIWKELRIPNDIDGGAIIKSVSNGTPASKAGLQSRDLITALDDQTVTNSSELRSYLYKKKQIGEQVKVTYYRNGQKQTATLTLERSPQ
ncbi:S1C family serine protease [Thermoactinomyces sp. DSM 45892]|uniref:S1C family serine protease n=1 Tax=Thermoactinomyces sp. DSM 45892 TaxID=1882753 RepID=UPI00089C06E9|nr:S1C family serine protease [Thermoactinomyces sp. DSM 45892]SDY37728.1 serine protease Do [Thermoactinomyces sp. DSM 45892]